MINRKAFLDAVRDDPFPGKLSKSQVAGLEAIITEWEKRKLTDLRWLAYMLATAYHETAHTMQPIAEYGRGRGRKYGVKGKHGQVAYGRGYVQLTWDYNYERADKELGLNGALIKNYELALRPDIASAIMFSGMIGGWFTTKKLADYFSGAKADWYNARRIINGVDKASMIGGYGRAFYNALVAADDAGAQPPPPVSSDLILRKGDGFTTNVTVAYVTAIKEAQRLLADRGFSAGLPPDGMFGSGTEAMVKAFQRQRGLTPDGVIGPKTWAALRSPNPVAAVMGLGEIDMAPVESDIDDFDLPNDERAEKITPVEWVISIGVIAFLLIGAVLGFKFLT